MFKITNSEIARAAQNRKGYVYDFGGRRFFLMRVCQSDGCGSDFCAGLSRMCIDVVRRRAVGVMVTADEYAGLRLIDSRFTSAGTVLLIEENGDVVYNEILSEDCLVVKLEGPVTTRVKLIPDRLYAIGMVSGKDSNALVVQAVSASHAKDIFGRLHDLRCSLTARLLVEGALSRKVGPSVGRPGRPNQQPHFDPARGTVLLLKGDVADPLPHEVRGLSDAEQKLVAERGLSGSASVSGLESESEYTVSDILGFESALVAGSEALDRFGASLSGSMPGAPIPAASFQDAADAIARLEEAKAVFGIPAAPAPVRPATIDDLAYAVSLVNHADAQVEGMRRKLVFTSGLVDGAIRAGLSSPSAAFGGNRVSVGDVPSAAGRGARIVSGRISDILGLARQNRLFPDVMVRAHRMWFRMEAYRQRMAELDPVFRMNRSALEGLSGDALADVGAKIGAATAELYLALVVSGASMQFGRTTLEGSEAGKLYQALNAHPAMLRVASDAFAALLSVEAPEMPIPSGSEDSNPAALIKMGFGVSISQLEELEQEFANSLGPDGYDQALGKIPAETQALLEAKLSAMFGAKPVSGTLPESFIDVARISAMYEGGRIAEEDA
jgi:hypothetical protein